MLAVSVCLSSLSSLGAPLMKLALTRVGVSHDDLAVASMFKQNEQEARKCAAGCSEQCSESETGPRKLHVIDNVGVCTDREKYRPPEYDNKN